MWPSRGSWDSLRTFASVPTYHVEVQVLLHPFRGGVELLGHLHDEERVQSVHYRGSFNASCEKQRGRREVRHPGGAAGVGRESESFSRQMVRAADYRHGSNIRRAAHRGWLASERRSFPDLDPTRNQNTYRESSCSLQTRGAAWPQNRGGQSELLWKDSVRRPLVIQQQKERSVRIRFIQLSVFVKALHLTKNTQEFFFSLNLSAMRDSDCHCTLKAKKQLQQKLFHTCFCAFIVSGEKLML